MGLLGWVAKCHRIDGEVPPEVIGILLRALCKSYRVTFRYPLPRDTSSSWSSINGEWRCMLRPRGLAKLVRRAIPLLSTTAPERAQQLFDAAPFSWSHQSQIVLLSPAATPPPMLAYKQMDQLWKIHVNADQPLPPDIVGMMVPAVDGDFAQIVAFEDSFWDEFLTALEAECRLAGVTWSVVNETEFQSTTWYVDDQSMMNK